MDIKNYKLNELKPYEKNPRRNDQAVKYVVESIKQFGFKVPIVIDKDNVIICGHTRYKAAKKLGLQEVPCIMADDLNEEQVKAFRLADNKVSEKAEWDLDLLDDEIEDIFNIDMADFGFDLDISDEIEKDDTKKQSLSDRFIIPPFSILDTRQGYWQDRKNSWKQLGIESEKGRVDNALKYSDTILSNSNSNGTSIFDPVLCEIMYNWFCPTGGKIFDCFAGGSVRGIVAEKCGFKYTGIDLRQDQIDENKRQANKIGLNPTWYCDDSLNCDKYLEDNSVDLIFSCPPYADLEVYSDDPRDISNMDYEDFSETYEKIIDKACKKLKDNRFAIFVVGDVRDKNGFYRNFIDLTKKIFNKNGCKTYNEFILLESVGTAAMRANRIFSSFRKVVKTHQNVLVFYKGDPKEIKNNYSEIEIIDLEDKGDEYYV